MEKTYMNSLPEEELKKAEDNWEKYKEKIFSKEIKEDDREIILQMALNIVEKFSSSLDKSGHPHNMVFSSGCISSLYDYFFKSVHWDHFIPNMKFDSSWEIKMMPNSMGSIVRFQVSNGLNAVRVTLLAYGIKTYYNPPYWEIFSYKGEIEEILLDTKDCKELMHKIRKMLQ